MSCSTPCMNEAAPPESHKAAIPHVTNDIDPHQQRNRYKRPGERQLRSDNGDDAGAGDELGEDGDEVSQSVQNRCDKPGPGTVLFADDADDGGLAGSANRPAVNEIQEQEPEQSAGMKAPGAVSIDKGKLRGSDGSRSAKVSAENDSGHKRGVQLSAFFLVQSRINRQKRNHHDAYQHPEEQHKTLWFIDRRLRPNRAPLD